MTKQSTVTVARRRCENVSASAGGFAVRAETVTIPTTDRIELVDLTERVMEFVRRSGVREGR